MTRWAQRIRATGTMVVVVVAGLTAIAVVASGGPARAQSGIFDDASAGADTTLTKDERTWAMLAHLLTLLGFVVAFGGFVAPLVIWLTKKEESSFVGDQALESLNFQITVAVAMLVAVLLICVGIGVFLVPVVVLADVVLVILASVRANEGERYRYPLTLRLVR